MTNYRHVSADIMAAALKASKPDSHQGRHHICSKGTVMKVKWNRVHFEPEPERKYLVWWNTKHGGVFAIGEYRERLGDMGPVWSANGNLERGKLVEFWAELPDKPSKED